MVVAFNHPSRLFGLVPSLQSVPRGFDDFPVRVLLSFGVALAGIDHSDFPLDDDPYIFNGREIWRDRRPREDIDLFRHLKVVPDVYRGVCRCIVVLIDMIWVIAEPRGNLKLENPVLVILGAEPTLDAVDFTEAVICN